MKHSPIAFVILLCWPCSVGAQEPGLPALERLERQVQAQSAGGVQPGYLGLVADDRQDEGRGIRVIEAVASGPAARAGLRVDDLIVSINDQPARSMSDMERVMLASPAGTELRFAVQRGTERLDLRVVLDARKANEPYGRIPTDAAAPPRATLGIRAIDAAGEALRFAGLPAATRGAAVQAIAPASPAEKAKVPIGAVIVGVNGQGISSAADLSNIVTQASPGDRLELSFYDRGQLIRRTAVLEAPPAETATTAKLSSTPAPGTAGSAPAVAGSPKPVEPPNAVAAPRIEVLEKRIEQLEQRVRELERALGKTPPGR